MDYYLIRFGAMRSLETFKYSNGLLIPGQKVIIRTERGLELGVVVNRSKITDESAGSSKAGIILRKVTREDRKHLDDIENVQIPDELRQAREKVTEIGLEMKIIYVEHLFAGDRVVFYFLANGRIDFRRLVKELARVYQTRIELKQVGVRDEARLLSDYEHCGRELCCRAWIKKLQPVTMKLAKNQKATLDPTKISGGCGRLMCCLRYEDKIYEELRKNLPRKKSFVRTKQGDGEVLDYDVLTQTVVIRDENGKRFMVAIDDILPKDASGPAPHKENNRNVRAKVDNGCPRGAKDGKECNGTCPNRIKQETPPTGQAARPGSGPAGETKAGGEQKQPGEKKSRSRRRPSRRSRRSGQAKKRSNQNNRQQNQSGQNNNQQQGNNQDKKDKGKE